MSARALEPGEIKALFRQLVKAVGGVQAAGVELGVSHQRVSVLQNPANPDLPTLVQVLALEVVAGRPIVTGAAARAISGAADDSMTAAAVASVASSADLIARVHAMEADGVRSQADIRSVQEAAQKNLREAQEAADAAARLSGEGAA